MHILTQIYLIFSSFFLHNSLFIKFIIIFCFSILFYFKFLMTSLLQIDPIIKYHITYVCQQNYKKKWKKKKIEEFILFYFIEIYCSNLCQIHTETSNCCCSLNFNSSLCQIQLPSIRIPNTNYLYRIYIFITYLFFIKVVFYNE